MRLDRTIEVVRTRMVTCKKPRDNGQVYIEKHENPEVFMNRTLSVVMTGFPTFFSFGFTVDCGGP